MNQKSLRGILEAILLPDNPDDAGLYIVPKQGNWYNPQDAIANPNKPATWVAYLLKDAKPRVLPFYQRGDPDDPDVPPVSTQLYIGKVQLQIVGTFAENIALSIGHWLQRSDVFEEFDSNNAQLLADGLGEYVVTDFLQDGLNDVLAYNMTFGIQWADLLASNQERLESFEALGSITTSV